MDRAMWRLTLVLLLAGLGCRAFCYALSFAFYQDEAMVALNILQRDYAGLTCELDDRQVAPVLFLWLEKAVTQVFGETEAVLRLPPLLAGLAGLCVFTHLARRALSPAAAVVAVGTLAVALWPVELAAMVKPYSLDLLLSATLLTLAVHHLHDPTRLRWLVLLTALIPVAVGMSYPVVFVAGAVSVVLLPVVWRTGSRAGYAWFTAYNVLLGTAFVAHLLLVGRAVYDPEVPAVQEFMAQYWTNGLPPRHPVGFLQWLVVRHVGRMFSYPAEWNGGGLVGFVLVVVGGVTLWRQRRFALLGLCAVPFALHLVAAVLHRYPYGAHQRLEQHLVPGMCLLLGVGVNSVIQRVAAAEVVRRRALAAVAAVLLLVGLLHAVGDARRPYHDAIAPWAGDIAAKLKRDARPDDVIVLSRSRRHSHSCLRWQLRPLAAQLRYEGKVDWVAVERTSGRVWLVDEQEALIAPDLPQPAPVEPARLLPGLAASRWQPVAHDRFVTQTPGPRRHVFRFHTDVHLLARPARSTAVNRP